MEFFDYLTLKCREAGHTDKEFIDAARFGAKCLNDRLVGDHPQKEEDLYDSSKYWCTIWRNTDERPKEGSQIVLRNGAMICYAWYQAGQCFNDGFQTSLKEFVGKWCYKEDMFGRSEERTILPRTMSVADTSSWWGKPVTQEELMAAFKKAVKEHLKYTYAFCIGFIDTSHYKEDGDSHIWIGNDDAPTQNGKRFVLMKAGNRFHKYLLKLEEEEDIHFERLTDETMREIIKDGLMLFTNEDGALHNPFQIEPIWEKPIDPEIAKITDEHFFEML